MAVNSSQLSVASLLLLLVVVVNGNLNLFMNTTETRRLLGQPSQSDIVYLIFIHKLNPNLNTVTVMGREINALA